MESFVIRGRTWKFGDDVNTDLIMPGKYKFSTIDLFELAKHAMEGIDPDFSKKVRKGDVIVAGKNFGCGSSREQAPLALKYLGVGAVVAKFFSRIFYRNAINVGLPVIQNEDVFEATKTGDILEINIKRGLIRNLNSGEEFIANPFPEFLLEILKDGGLVKHYKKHGGFLWQSIK